MAVFPDFTKIDLLPSDMMTALFKSTSRTVTNAEQIDIPALATGDQKALNLLKKISLDLRLSCVALILACMQLALGQFGNMQASLQPRSQIAFTGEI